MLFLAAMYQSHINSTLSKSQEIRAPYTKMEVAINNLLSQITIDKQVIAILVAQPLNLTLILTLKHHNIKTQIKRSRLPPLPINKEKAIMKKLMMMMLTTKNSQRLPPNPLK